ncbi:hypothetical protein N7326_03350 [Corynebacterium sp. ES2794-CONJ1]|nr:hypothetical protein [Corynebacterium sp. ES2794-CONJ1]
MKGHIMHNYRHLLSGVALASALATGAALLPAPTAVIPQGIAHETSVDGYEIETSDAMPHKYYVDKAADSAQYMGELHTFHALSQLRHVYHTAAYQQKYADYTQRTPKMNQAHQLSEDNCYIAKARLGLAMMKVEGDAAARALDLSKVGFDFNESKQALELLRQSSTELLARRDALKAQDSLDKRIALINNREKIVSDGANRLRDIIGDLEAGTPTAEISPFAVVNYDIAQGFVDCELGLSTDAACRKLNNDRDEKRYPGHPLTDHAKQLTVTVVDPLVPNTGMRPAIERDAETNQQLLELAYGALPKANHDPAPSHTPSPAPQPPTTSAQPTPDLEPDEPANPQDMGVGRIVGIVVGVIAGLIGLAAIVIAAFNHFIPR